MQITREQLAKMEAAIGSSASAAEIRASIEAILEEIRIADADESLHRRRYEDMARQSERGRTKRSDRLFC
jgi:predicted nucleic acid-binding protein